MARMTKQDVEAKIDAALAAGEVYNVELTDIRDALSRMVDQAKDDAQKVYLGVSHSLDRSNGYDNTLSDVYFAHPYPHTLPGFVKKLPKQVPPVWQPALDAYRAFAQEWLPVCEKFIALKKLPVLKGRAPVSASVAATVDRKALEAEKAKLQDQVRYNVGTLGSQMIARGRIREINKLLNANDAAKFGTSAIAKAFLPMKTEAMEYARVEATKYNEALRDRLEKADWNLDKIVPVAPEGSSVEAVKTANARRNAYMRVAKRDDARLIAEGFMKPSKYKKGEHVLVDGAPTYLTYDAEKAQRAIEQDVAETASVFDSFVTKMDHKVGEHDSAEVEGRPWIGATVTVTKGRVKEVWHTQQIINRSVYGKLFNQWPTRLAGSEETV
jgi:hypothetical protein